MKEHRQRLWLQWRRMEKRIRAKDELYDVSMLRGYGCKNDGYGELLPAFSKQLAEVLNITATTKILDVGSGIGFLCFDLACLSGCSVRGIEIRRDIYLKSVQIAKHVCDRMKLDVSFLYGDGTADTVGFMNMDIVICCNTLWSGENNYRLLQKLCSQMRPGTRVVVLEQLGGQRYHSRSPRAKSDILSACFHLPPEKHQSEPGSVSWTDKSINFYVYTKKKISREVKDLIEKDRDSVQRTPKHRTDPHVAEAGLHRTKRVLDAMEDVEDGAEDAESAEDAEDASVPAKRVKRDYDDDDDDVIELDADEVVELKAKPAKPAIPARIVSKRPAVKAGAAARGPGGFRSRKVVAAAKQRLSSRMPSADAVLPQTRAAARAEKLQSNTPPPPLPEDPRARLRSSATPPTTPPTSSDSTSSDHSLVKSTKRNFGTTSRQRFNTSTTTPTTSTTTTTTTTAAPNEQESEESEEKDVEQPQPSDEAVVCA